MSIISYIAALTGVVGLVYWIGWCIYSIWFHPLAKYPGPLIAKVTVFWYAKQWTSGRWPFLMRELHEKYGKIIRIAPNELTFSSAQSQRDIYGTPKGGRKTFNKAKEWYDVSDNPGISLTWDPELHAVQRRLLAPGFSARSLRSQEDIIHQYTDLFMEQIERLSNTKEGVEMSKAFSWLTFDIAGELAFGESFDAVKEAKSHFWISLINDSANALSVAALCRRLPVLYLALPFVLKRGTIGNFRRHQALTEAKTRKRIEMGNAQNRQDFFGHILDGELSERDLAANANVLIIAGAETTATALAAATALLLAHPGCLARLRAEVLAAFGAGVHAITGDAAARLPYLNAVIEETLRYHPPTAHGFPRTSPGETVDGEYVPRGVMVSSDINLVGRGAENFERPDEFRPERWLEDPSLRERMSSFAFSMGTYGCLGINMAYLEMRVVLAKMVFRFDWELVDPAFDFEAGSSYYTLWKKPDMFVRYHPRT